MLHAVASFRALPRSTWLLSIGVFLALGAAMNAIGHLLSIAWFKSWWQVAPCYLGYVLPLAVLLRPLHAREQWRWSVLAFMPLELVGYALGTSVIADDNVIAAVVGPHNFTLAMVLIVCPTPIVGNAIVDGLVGLGRRFGSPAHLGALMLRFKPPARTNVVDIYDDRAGAWWDFSDPIFEPLHALLPARSQFLDRHGIDVAGKVVADVGAGGGYVSGLLRERGAQVVAVDIARKALLAGATHHGKRPEGDRPLTAISWAEASATRLPLRDRSVDVCVCTDVLVHLPVQIGGAAAGLREMARALKPGGTLWFSTINDTALARFVYITLGEDVLRVIHKGTHDPSTWLSPADMKRMLDDNGLDMLSAEGFGPVGVTRRLSLKMGRVPTLQGFWQGHAVKRGA